MSISEGGLQRRGPDGAPEGWHPNGANCRTCGPGCGTEFIGPELCRPLGILRTLSLAFLPSM